MAKVIIKTNTRKWDWALAIVNIHRKLRVRVTAVYFAANNQRLVLHRKIIFGLRLTSLINQLCAGKITGFDRFGRTLVNL
jgi:hypothetical protein